MKRYSIQSLHFGYEEKERTYIVTKNLIGPTLQHITQSTMRFYQVVALANWPRWSEEDCNSVLWLVIASNAAIFKYKFHDIQQLLQLGDALTRFEFIFNFITVFFLLLEELNLWYLSWLCWFTGKQLFHWRFLFRADSRIDVVVQHSPLARCPFFFSPWRRFQPNCAEYHIVESLFLSKRSSNTRSVLQVSQ